MTSVHRRPATERTPDRRTGATGPARRLLARRVAVDALVPVALYYLMRAGGIDVLTATLAAAAVPAGIALAVVARSRRIDVASLVVVSLFLAGGVISLVTGDPRVLYVKDGWFTGLLGVWVLASLAMSRPMMLHLGVAIATAKVGDAGAAAWRRRWDDDRVFRRRLRLVSVVVGAVLVLDAVVRVVIAYTVAVDDLATATNVQYVVMLTGLLSWFFWYTGRHGLRA